MVNALSKEKKSCKICSYELVMMGKCFICENCKAIAWTQNIDKQTFFENIKATIESIQSYLESENDWLHDIEQRYMCAVPISEKELSVKSFCEEFLDCRLWLSAFMKDGVRTDDRMFRQKLYQLLCLSLQFNEVFENNCIELII